MPSHDCPFPECAYNTGESTDDLAATLLKIHFAGAHPPTPSPAENASTASAASTAARVQKVSRPTASLGMTSEEWSYFLTRWQDYVEATKVTGKEKIIQLLECCDEELRKDLTRTAGGTLSNRTEEDVLAAMKLLAVREENTMVARVALYEMRQDTDEGIRSFGARIRGQANVCKFLLSCPHCTEDVSYTNEILRDVLTRGIADHEIQLDLLGDSNQDMTLEETFKFVEAKEAGKRSANKLLQVQSVSSARSSQYRQRRNESRLRRSDKSNDVDRDPTCDYCGNRGHGKSAPLPSRRVNCPAYGKLCTLCQKMNHLAPVCRKGKAMATNDNNAGPAASTGALFHTTNVVDETVQYQLCTITFSNGNDRSIVLDHHLYDHLGERWTRQPSKPQPFITLKIRICTTDYAHFGFRPPRSTKSIDAPTMADTGCQCCLAGMLIIRLGLNEHDLIPVTTQMQAANNNKIKILGAVLLEFSGTSSTGEHLHTRQITYVTDSSDKLFLSREGCAKLGMISDSFPTVGDIHTRQHSHTIATVTDPEHVEPVPQIQPPLLTHQQTLTIATR